MQVLKDKKLVYNCFGSNLEVQLHVMTYSNGRVGLQLVSEMEDMPGHWEPFATASVNLPDEPCPSNEVWIKDWSENEGMTDWLADAGVIERHPTAGARSGFVTAYRHKLTLAFIEELAKALIAGKEMRK